MNSKTKKRLIVVTGVIIIVLLVVLALVGGNSAAKTVSVAEAASGDFANQRVQVSGNVVENSYSTQGNVLTFAIYDPEGDMSVDLPVTYDGGVAATFGNDVTAICTGTMDEQGNLACSELVTKCPSKYESATEALGVAQLKGYGDSVLNKPVKVTGVVKAGSQNAAGAGDRFVLVDADDSTSELRIVFDDALSAETTADGAVVVVSGNITNDGAFSATDVALKG